jgi:hypothetical protein
MPDIYSNTPQIIPPKINTLSTLSPPYGQSEFKPVKLTIHNPIKHKVKKLWQA